MDTRPVRARMAFAISTLAVMVFSANLFLAEADRPELLTRTFSRDYLVKYLGINAFTVYDGVQTYQASQVRAEASPNDMNEVESYVRNITRNQMMICSVSQKARTSFIFT